MQSPPRFFLYVYCDDLAPMREFYSHLVGLEEVFYKAGLDGGLGYYVGDVQFTILPASGTSKAENWHRQPGWEGGR